MARKFIIGWFKRCLPTKDYGPRELCCGNYSWFYNAITKAKENSPKQASDKINTSSKGPKRFVCYKYGQINIVETRRDKSQMSTLVLLWFLQQLIMSVAGLSTQEH